MINGRRTMRTTHFVQYKPTYGALYYYYRKMLGSESLSNVGHKYYKFMYYMYINKVSELR
jgi:hypothetical protein